MYENKKICSACGGQCCNTLPGACFPSDFNLPGDISFLETALKTGRWAIDWWEGDPRQGGNEYSRGFFVRPAIKGQEGKMFDGSWGGVCTFLKNDCCALDADKRPSNCRNLEPKESGCITHDDSKRGAAIAWIPYYKILEDMED